MTVGSRVRVNPGTSDERSGTIVEDFGDDAGVGVDVGSQHIADPSRRWAIILDNGSLAFVDSSNLLALPDTDFDSDDPLTLGQPHRSRPTNLHDAR
ncbi:hypothetical protein [Mycobacterium paraintracellulare]|uniref:hypothetical protein n=1 Tax=Mycobacterium paraintracellulare TaxID=1138383 RepID=UPI001F44ACB2|nr:hypothetical protein [Mycobacterium paraintracellulare]